MLFSDLSLICYPNFRRIRRSRFSLNMKLIKEYTTEENYISHNQNIFRYLSFIPLQVWPQVWPCWFEWKIVKKCRCVPCIAFFKTKYLKIFFVIFLSNRQRSHLWPHRGWDNTHYPTIPDHTHFYLIFMVSFLNMGLAC